VGTGTPRVVPLLYAAVLLVAINRAAPRLLPAVLFLLVLYAALTNLPRAEALLGGIDDALARIIRPSSASGYAGPVGGH